MVCLQKVVARVRGRASRRACCHSPRFCTDFMRIAALAQLCNCSAPPPVGALGWNRR